MLAYDALQRWSALVRLVRRQRVLNARSARCTSATGAKRIREPFPAVVGLTEPKGAKSLRWWF